MSVEVTVEEETTAAIVNLVKQLEAAEKTLREIVNFDAAVGGKSALYILQTKAAMYFERNTPNE